MEPGSYECIFSPWAFLDLIEPLRHHFDAGLCQKGKSFFSKLLGRQVFSKGFSLYEDVRHPGQFGVPFDAEGVPKKRIALVERGKIKGLLGKGHSTRGILEHPVYPQNLVAEKGGSTLDEMFKDIRRGIYIGKIWYPTLVRESGTEVTGLASAGCLFLERGKIRGGVVHLRYHDSLFSILRSVVGTTKERILVKDGEMGAALLPYIRVSRLRVV